LQAVVDGLIPLLGPGPTSLSSEQRRHLFNDVLPSLLRPDQVSFPRFLPTQKAQGGHRSNTICSPPYSRCWATLSLNCFIACWASSPIQRPKSLVPRFGQREQSPTLASTDWLVHSQRARALGHAQIMRNMADACNPREMWILLSEALGRAQPTATKVLIVQLLPQGGLPL